MVSMFSVRQNIFPPSVSSPLKQHGKSLFEGSGLSLLTLHPVAQSSSGTTSGVSCAACVEEMMWKTRVPHFPWCQTGAMGSPPAALGTDRCFLCSVGQSQNGFAPPSVLRRGTAFRFCMHRCCSLKQILRHFTHSDAGSYWGSGHKATVDDKKRGLKLYRMERSSGREIILK